jgi:hypothetical protein
MDPLVVAGDRCDIVRWRHLVDAFHRDAGFGRELLAVDGTRFKAVNNKDRNFTRASLT